MAPWCPNEATAKQVKAATSKNTLADWPMSHQDDSRSPITSKKEPGSTSVNANVTNKRLAGETDDSSVQRNTTMSSIYCF